MEEEKKEEEEEEEEEEVEEEEEEEESEHGRISGQKEGTKIRERERKRERETGGVREHLSNSCLADGLHRSQIMQRWQVSRVSVIERQLF